MGANSCLEGDFRRHGKGSGKARREGKDSSSGDVVDLTATQASEAWSPGASCGGRSGLLIYLIPPMVSYGLLQGVSLCGSSEKRGSSGEELGVLAVGYCLRGCALEGCVECLGWGTLRVW